MSGHIQNLFAQRLANKVHEALSSKLHGQNSPQASKQRRKDERRELVGKQPRGKCTELVADFKDIRWVTASSSADTRKVEDWTRALKEEITLGGEHIPIGSRKLQKKDGKMAGQLEVKFGIPKPASGHQQIHDKNKTYVRVWNPCLEMTKIPLDELC